MPKAVNASAGAAGATAIVVIWVFSLVGIIIPAEVAVSIALGLVWVAGLAAAKLGGKASAAEAKPGEGE